jgi:hypothetical protein
MEEAAAVRAIISKGAFGSEYRCKFLLSNGKFYRVVAPSHWVYTDNGVTLEKGSLDPPPSFKGLLACQVTWSDETDAHILVPDCQEQRWVGAYSVPLKYLFPRPGTEGAKIYQLQQNLNKLRKRCRKKIKHLIQILCPKPETGPNMPLFPSSYELPDSLYSAIEGVARAKFAKEYPQANWHLNLCPLDGKISLNHTTPAAEKPRVYIDTQHYCIECSLVREEHPDVFHQMVRIQQWLWYCAKGVDEGEPLPQ